jgi:ATP-dependent DNA ligase
MASSRVSILMVAPISSILLFRRRHPCFCGFDLLMLDGEDVRALPLLDRKRRLLDVMPPTTARVR